MGGDHGKPGSKKRAKYNQKRYTLNRKRKRLLGFDWNAIA
jgi:hypothetical protein